MTQGPISTYSQLAGQLYEGHAFTYENFALGGQRMIWGYFKKLVLADVLAPWVGAVFQHYPDYTGGAVLVGIFFYSIRIYADFSGYMDIMCGFCQIIGIRLEENFLRPYFSKSIAEYWRRWHITLGAWFKNYLYYPIAVSKWNTKIGKWGRRRFGKTFGQAMPASIALVAVWLTTGLWHGASWAYIAWGGVNGLFIIVSLWLDPGRAAYPGGGMVVPGVSGGAHLCSGVSHQGAARGGLPAGRTGAVAADVPRLGDTPVLCRPVPLRPRPGSAGGGGPGHAAAAVYQPAPAENAHPDLVQPVPPAGAGDDISGFAADGGVFRRAGLRQCGRVFV